jgi:transposase
MSHIKGKSRKQLLFLPNSIEEYVEENNPVRVIDAFVDTLDLKELGFSKAEPAYTGRPSYDPADLLKLYIYGYMNKLRSSRRLMRECRRNIELFYLLNELKPDFRTIADFRKDNAEAIRKVFREFTFICSDMGLYKKELVAIDGTKVRAQNSDDKVFNKDILIKKLARIDAHIDEYMTAVKKNDESGADDDAEDDQRLSADDIKDKLEDLNKRRNKYTGYLRELESTGKTQILETDPECHRMHTRNGFHCCYNVQAATDAGSHLICAYEVSGNGNDQGQLSGAAFEARDNLGTESLEVVADKGYESRADILNAVMHGIIPNVAMKYDREERLFNLDYEYAEITDEIKSSMKPEDIMKCFKAGVLPACFEDSIVSAEVQGLSSVACFKRMDENTVLCPMNRILKKVKRRNGRQTIFKSKEACRTCPNRCTASNSAKEVSFVDGVEYVPARMYGKTGKPPNTLPEDYVPHHNSRALHLKRAKAKVVIRVKCDDEKVHTRMCTVEHPFGSVKWYGDAGYVLCRGKRKVSAEIGLSFLAYNMKRAINMVGTEELIKAMEN